MAVCIPLLVMPDTIGRDQIFVRDCTAATFTDIPMSNFIEMQEKGTVKMMHHRLYGVLKNYGHMKKIYI